MLSPEDRELLVDAVRPDPGYTLDHALITTYSLNLDALLGIPVALTFNSWTGDESHSGDETARGDRLDPVALLDSLRRHADRLTVIGQAGAIAVPKASNFLSFLEPVVHGVSAPRGGIFHPKLWLLRYEAENPDDPVRYRLLCLSRNLTFDRSWDTILRLDATLAPGAGERPENAPLRDFIEGVIGLAAESPGSLAEARHRKLATMAAEAPRLEFDLPEGVESLAFWPLGFTDTSPERVFAGRRDRTLVVSPFVTDGFLNRIKLGAEDELVSRPDELALLSDETRDRPARISVLGDVATAEPESDQDDEEPAPPTSEDMLSGLHAKLYISDAGWRSRVWTGSANATSAAFGLNVEFMVELRGLKSAVGIEAVLGPDGGEGMEKLLIPYAHDPDLAPDAEQRRLEQETDRLARDLGASALELRAANSEEGWSLSLAMTGAAAEIPGELEVSAWPATLSDHRSQPLADTPDPPSWSHLEVTHLTGFLCFSIRAPDHDFERRFAITVPLRGAPADRNAAIVRSILADESRVLRYLLFLLGGHGADAMDAISDLSPATEDGAAGAWRGMGQDATLFEALIRSLHADPGRIDSVERLLEDLGEEESSALLPPGFHSIFGPVIEARKRLASR